MLINEDPQWQSGFADDDLQMFPELGTFEDETALPADDFLEALSSDLEIPMLLSGEGSPTFDESPDEIMKNALETQTLEDVELDFMSDDGGINEFSDYFADDITKDSENLRNIKIDSNSPFIQLPPSPSPSQSDSSSGSEWQSEASSVTHSESKFALETPPISPPHSESPPTSPQPAQTNPSLLQQIKVLPLSSLTSKDGTAPKFILSDNNPAKRICIQPKLDNMTTKETGRKTILLSPKDFAALTQNMKQNSQNQPLKVQALPLSKQVKIQNQLNLLPVQQQQQKANTNVKPIIQGSQIKIVNAIPSMQVVQTKAPTIVTSCKPIVTSDTKPSPPIVIKKENNNQPIVIKNSLPVCSPIIIKKENTNIVVKNEFPDLIDFQDRQDSELKAIKRQQRMIKNRESACLSRKKKKEYVTSLENQIADLQEQNTKLSHENAELRRRLCALEGTQDKKSAGPMSSSINKKNTAIMLAMVFMVSVNVSGFGTVFNQQRQPLSNIEPQVPPLSLANVRHGRTLLWSNDQDDLSSSPKETFNDTLPLHNPMCPMHINQTESIRLDYELRRWIGGEPGRENWTKPAKTDLEVKSLNDLLILRNHPTAAAASGEKKKDPRLPSKRLKNRKVRVKDVPTPANLNAVQVFSPLLKEHAKLFEALGRRDDTFYVVWFTGDHLLLPASRKNSTSRPRMSLVLPAVPVNGTYSTPPNHVTMMQIDCEVTNTQLLHLQQSIIPEHLRNQQPAENTSREEGMPERVLNNTKTYKPYFLKGNDKDTMNNGTLKRPYTVDNQNLYDEKKTLFGREKEDNEFSTETDDELKKVPQPQERLMFRKLRRSVH